MNQWFKHSINLNPLPNECENTLVLLLYIYALRLPNVNITSDYTYSKVCVELHRPAGNITIFFDCIMQKFVY